MNKILFNYIFVSGLIFLIIPITYMTLNSDMVTASDWVRHLNWIERYIKGDPTPLLEYPPLFHWLMLPLVYFNFPVKYFQIFFIILASASIIYFTRKMEGKYPMILITILMATSLAYLMWFSALMPQSLDYFLFPLILLAYFNDKRLLVLLGIVTIFFMHVMGMMFLAILMVHASLTNRRNFLYPLLILLIVLLPYFYLLMQNLAGNEMFINYEVEAFYLNPFRFFFLSGIFTWILLPLASHKLIKEKVKFDERLLLYIIWIVCFIPMGIFGYGIWRMVSYIIIPLSLFVIRVIK